jgi:hypothetical protein
LLTPSTELFGEWNTLSLRGLAFSVGSQVAVDLREVHLRVNDEEAASLSRLGLSLTLNIERVLR